MITFELLVIGAGILAMLFAFWKTTWISKQDQGTAKMEKMVNRTTNDPTKL